MGGKGGRRGRAAKEAEKKAVRGRGACRPGKDDITTE